MKFAAALLALATAAVALPSSRERFERRLARRAPGAHQSQPKRIAAGPQPQFTNATNAEFSENWSGAVLIAGGVITLDFP